MENLDFCIDALRGAMMLSGQALQVEIAVAFIVFDRMGSTDFQAKKVLRGIYASAGRADCLTPDSPSYQTVNRRMSRCADFYDTVRAGKVRKLLKPLAGQAAIDALVTLIASYQVQTMDDVARRTGKEPQAHKDAVGSFHVKTEHIKIDMTPDVTADEILALIKELRALVKTKQVELV